MWKISKIDRLELNSLPISADEIGKILLAISKITEMTSSFGGVGNIDQTTHSAVYGSEFKHRVTFIYRRDLKQDYISAVVYGDVAKSIRKILRKRMKENDSTISQK